MTTEIANNQIIFTGEETDLGQENSSSQYPINHLEKITMMLRTNSSDIKITHREKEKKQIVNFLFKNLSNDNENDIKTTCMIMFGQPGLGKTILLQEISNSFQDGSIKEIIKEIGLEEDEMQSHYIERIRVGDIKVHFFNSMNYNSVSELLKDILISVFMATESRDYNDPEYLFNNIKTIIEKQLKEKKLILMIDELEHLRNNDASNFSILINLLNYKHKGFVKFGISNTLNLISEVSNTTIELNFEFLIFKPYKKQSLKNILIKRINTALVGSGLETKEVMPDNSLDFIVKKIIINNHSDVRFLLSSVSKLIENKITALKKKVKEGIDISEQSFEITMLEVIRFFPQPNNKKDYILYLQDISFHAKCLLLAIYETLENQTYTVLVKKVEKMYKKILSNFAYDLPKRTKMYFETLHTYNFIKRPDSKNVVSLFMKKELKKVLMSQVEFKEYFGLAE